MGAGLDADTLEMTLDAIREFTAQRLSDQTLIDLDHRDEMPLELVREMCGPELGVQLLFIPEEYGGMGGGTFDVYRVCEAMAGIDLGIATAVLATFLGSDPIRIGGTEVQRKEWLGRIAGEGILFAYGATEPEAGSDLGALKTTATPVLEDGRAVAYRISGQKQWISNGGVADAYTILASTEAGPSWFVVDRGAPGFTHGNPEDKHGIRASNTAALFLDDVEVPADRLIGEVEGQGLLQAQQVFGYTRLMVAAFGLGAGWAALDRAIEYSIGRLQAGGPLSEKQGYTHKLIVPHVLRLEAARASIEEAAERIDAGEGSLNTEGAIAKYLASEAGNDAAEAAIQAHGGYGYVKEYLVEKIKRDVRITTIYEGTSEIMEMTIARDRWQEHLKTRGRYYLDLAERLEALHSEQPSVGADAAAAGARALAEILERCRTARLTRNQHVLLRLGELIAQAECAGALARKAARAIRGELDPKANRRFGPETLATVSRCFAREAAFRVAHEGLRWVLAADPEGDPEELAGAIGLTEIDRMHKGLMHDMDEVADALYGRAS
jgi:alkylation response protein AidB-like acyl-CoA dehydrogenase